MTNNGVMMIGVLVLISLSAFILWCGISSESKSYNHGVCPRCSHKLMYDDHYDDEFERSYICGNCGYYTYVTWSFIDGKSKKRNKKKKKKGRDAG